MCHSRCVVTVTTLPPNIALPSTSLLSVGPTMDPYVNLSGQVAGARSSDHVQYIG